MPGGQRTEQALALPSVDTQRMRKRQPGVLMRSHRPASGIAHLEASAACFPRPPSAGSRSPEIRRTLEPRPHVRRDVPAVRRFARAANGSRRARRNGSTPWSGAVSARSSRLPSQREEGLQDSGAIGPRQVAHSAGKSPAGRRRGGRAVRRTAHRPARRAPVPAAGRLTAAILPVDVVPAETLVAAVARQRNRHVAPHRRRDLVSRRTATYPQTAGRPCA